MTIDTSEFGPMKSGIETDAKYRVRDDGKFVAVFDAEGDEFLVGLRIEDVAAIMTDMHEIESSEAY